ncbi:hypothetical protein HOLleu_28106 [Holothuria leucospilota]|uniref:Uncharacterized protein n=1 Tax=Holothuria leucospilota TaxID=206669 RepID=A0A9Q1H017_HOLLE|nr:hypothetical protein HOLleu_28106 [Holothuria leucospilota]
MSLYIGQAINELEMLLGRKQVLGRMGSSRTTERQRLSVALGQASQTHIHPDPDWPCRSRRSPINGCSVVYHLCACGPFRGMRVRQDCRRFCCSKNIGGSLHLLVYFGHAANAPSCVHEYQLVRSSHCGRCDWFCKVRPASVASAVSLQLFSPPLRLHVFKSLVYGSSPLASFRGSALPSAQINTHTHTCTQSPT